jgi:hypothetical protein
MRRMTVGAAIAAAAASDDGAKGSTQATSVSDTDVRRDVFAVRLGVDADAAPSIDCLG